jgi:peptidoglycan hydrolase CwlO-like protein
LKIEIYYYYYFLFSDLEQELCDKQANAQLLEREVTEGRRRCTELEEELDQVNKEIGEARVC